MLEKLSQWYANLGRPVKIIATIIVGSLGSGLWEVAIKPLGIFTFKTLSIFLLSINSGILDSSYRSAPSASYTDLIPSILLLLPLIVSYLLRIVDKLNDMTSQSLKDRIINSRNRASDTLKSLKSIEERETPKDESTREKFNKEEVINSLESIIQDSNSDIEGIDKIRAKSRRTSLLFSLAFFSFMWIPIFLSLFAVAKNREFVKEYNITLSYANDSQSDSFLSRFYQVSGKKDFDDLIYDMKNLRKDPK